MLFKFLLGLLCEYVLCFLFVKMPYGVFLYICTLLIILQM